MEVQKESFAEFKMLNKLQTNLLAVNISMFSKKIEIQIQNNKFVFTLDEIINVKSSCLDLNLFQKVKNLKDEVYFTKLVLFCESKNGNRVLEEIVFFTANFGENEKLESSLKSKLGMEKSNDEKVKRLLVVYQRSDEYISTRIEDFFKAAGFKLALVETRGRGDVKKFLMEMGIKDLSSYEGIVCVGDLVAHERKVRTHSNRGFAFSNSLPIRGLSQIKAALKDMSIDSSDTDLSEIDVNSNYFLNYHSNDNFSNNDLVANMLKILKITEIDENASHQFYQSFGSQENFLSLLMNKKYESLLMGFSNLVLLSFLKGEKLSAPSATKELQSKSKLIYKNANTATPGHRDTPNFEKSSSKKLAKNNTFVEKHIIVDHPKNNNLYSSHFYKPESPELKNVSPILKKTTSKNLNLNLEKVKNSENFLNSANTKKAKHTKTVSNTEFTPASTKHARHPTQSTNLPKHKCGSIAEKNSICDKSDFSPFISNKSQLSQINYDKAPERKINEPYFGISDVPRKKKFEYTDHVSLLLENINTPISIEKKGSIFKEQDSRKKSNFNPSPSKDVEIKDN